MGDGNVQRVIDHDERRSKLREEFPTVDLGSTEDSTPSPPFPMGKHSPESQQKKSLFQPRSQGLESTDIGNRREQRMDEDHQISAERCAQRAESSGSLSEIGSRPGISTDGTDSFVRLSLQSFPDIVQPNHESLLCDICVFKRRIIERDELEHALYITPVDKFNEVLTFCRVLFLRKCLCIQTFCEKSFVMYLLSQVFPRIKKDEALVYHGTEFPVGEEHRTSNFSSLHQTFLVTENISVGFEVLHGQKFAVVSPPTTIASLSEIRSKSEERIACGFSVKVLTKCTGGKDDLHQDIIKVKLQSENRTLHLLFPVAYYEASESHWLYDSVSCTPTCMPDEDREALRSCYVALLDNIGDVVSLCEHLYQHKILEYDDLEYIRNIPKKRDRNAYVLRTLQTRGNILDFVIKVMQRQRQNQGAAAILQRRRYCGADV